MYAILVIIALELYIRVFHLTKDYPSRYIDEYGVEKWMPNQSGFSVTGNRRQNFSEYHINNSGFNSYREYQPSNDKVEIGLVGDSFIEGFHQNYYNSIGKKIEKRLNSVEVYEFGYAGYDFADQLHLVHSYKEEFDLIDFVAFGLKFENDLYRAEYKIVDDRMKLESTLYKNLRKIKVLAYVQNIGALDPLRNLPVRLLTFFKEESKKTDKKLTEEERFIVESDTQLKKLNNFKSLVSLYGYDKERYVLLLDKKKTPDKFIGYLEANGFAYIDFSEDMDNSKLPTTLIYDKHWNDRGRAIIAKLITRYLKSKV